MALFDYRSVSVTTSASQILSAAARNARKYVLLSAHPDNTGDIYIGNSSSVVADKTNAAGGFCLKPGQSRVYDVQSQVDGLTQADIYGIASTGTQYLYWELQ